MSPSTSHRGQDGGPRRDTRSGNRPSTSRPHSTAGRLPHACQHPEITELSPSPSQPRPPRAPAARSSPLKEARRQEGQPSRALALPCPSGATLSSGPCGPASRAPHSRVPMSRLMRSALPGTCPLWPPCYMTLQLGFPQLRGSVRIRLSFPEDLGCCPAKVRRPPLFFSEEKRVATEVTSSGGCRDGTGGGPGKGPQEGLCLASTPESDHTALHRGQVLGSAVLGT